MPSVTDCGDYVVDLSNTLETALAAHLSFVISHSCRHESAPPPGALREDHRCGGLVRLEMSEPTTP
jgi:hypothetical protein